MEYIEINQKRYKQRKACISGRTSAFIVKNKEEFISSFNEMLENQKEDYPVKLQSSDELFWIEHPNGIESDVDLIRLIQSFIDEEWCCHYVWISPHSEVTIQVISAEGSYDLNMAHILDNYSSSKKYI